MPKALRTRHGSFAEPLEELLPRFSTARATKGPTDNEQAPGGGSADSLERTGLRRRR